jgi:hypothetical protein
VREGSDDSGKSAGGAFCLWFLCVAFCVCVGSQVIFISLMRSILNNKKKGSIKFFFELFDMFSKIFYVLKTFISFLLFYFVLFCFTWLMFNYLKPILSQQFYFINFFLITFSSVDFSLWFKTYRILFFCFWPRSWIFLLLNSFLFISYFLLFLWVWFFFFFFFFFFFVQRKYIKKVENCTKWIK